MYVLKKLLYDMKMNTKVDKEQVWFENLDNYGNAQNLYSFASVIYYLNAGLCFFYNFFFIAM